MDIVAYLPWIILFIVGSLFIWREYVLFKSLEQRSKNTQETVGLLHKWAEGLSQVSGIPIEKIWTMPSDEIEELRTKYNYR